MIMANRTFVLDTSVFVTFPEILERDLAGVRLVVPSVVLDELERAAHRQPHLTGMFAAIRAEPSRFQIIDSGLVYRSDSGGVKYGDIQVLLAAEELRSSGASPVVVTEDRDLRNAASASGITTATTSILRSLSVAHNNAGSKEVSAYRRGRAKARRLLVLGNLVLGSALTLAIQNSALIVRWVRAALLQHPSAAVTGALMLSALVAHAAKRWNPYWYGSFEIICGCFVCYVTSELSSGGAYSPSPLSLAVAYAGGAFTIVRGLGNMYDGLDALIEYPRLQTALRTLLDPAGKARARGIKR